MIIGTKKYRENVVEQTNVKDITNRQLFLSNNNKQWLIATLYKDNIKSGGGRSMQWYKAYIPVHMETWLDTVKVDKYSALVSYDTSSLLSSINNDFIVWLDKEHSLINNEYKMITATHLFNVYDYRNFDAYKGLSGMVRNDTFRYNNTIPLYQKAGQTRQHDRDNTEGLRVHELDVITEGGRDIVDRGYNMNKAFEQADRPYDSIDRYTMPYYGVSKSDQDPYTLP